VQRASRRARGLPGGQRPGSDPGLAPQAAVTVDIGGVSVPLGGLAPGRRTPACGPVGAGADLGGEPPMFAPSAPVSLQPWTAPPSWSSGVMDASDRVGLAGSLAVWGRAGPGGFEGWMGTATRGSPLLDARRLKTPARLSTRTPRDRGRTLQPLPTAGGRKRPRATPRPCTRSASATASMRASTGSAAGPRGRRPHAARRRCAAAARSPVRATRTGVPASSARPVSSPASGAAPRRRGA
jgi:hypothetical protein